MTPGETDLSTLIASMRPTLDDTVYVFVTTTESMDEAALQPLMRFEEAEGTTYIVTQDRAERAGLPGVFPSKRITLNIHSSLDAVGFIAVIATRLAKIGLGVNPVAGFYHDHLFVPESRADDAMAELQQLVSEYARPGDV